MSSTYAVLCLSHDPAVVAADGDWNRAEMAEAAIVAGIDNHEQCDLLIGRYSYPLIELGCPPSNGDRRHSQHRCNAHSGTQWVDLVWLRMLAFYREHPEGAAMAGLAGESVTSCWPAKRLDRLRTELGLNAKSELASPPPCAIDHDCPGQVRPEPLTARGEARCQSQHRRGDGPLVQCVLAVHRDDTHTDYAPGQTPPPDRDPEMPWLTWRDKGESDASTVPVADGQSVAILYVNHRGQRGYRQVRPLRVWFGTTEWHRELQWFLDATDLDRDVLRSFALRDVLGFDLRPGPLA